MLTVGWASREFTPDRPALLQGQRYRRIAREASDPLTVTALALESEPDDEAVVLVSGDLTNVSQGLLRRSRELVEGSVPALAGEQVVLCATHTHESVVQHEGRYEHPGGDVLTPAESTELVAERVADAVEASWDRRRPHAVERGFGRAVVGHNRYAVYDDGHAEMYGATDTDDFSHVGGYEDHSLDMLFSWTPDGALDGVLLAIPCPAQVDEHLESFSADYWHDVRVELRSRLGERLSVLGLCSAAGDQSPHRLLHEGEEGTMRERRGTTEREEIARRVADAVEDALACTDPDTDRGATLRHSRPELDLPPLRHTEKDRRWAERMAEESADEDWLDGRRAASLREILERDAGDERDPVSVETHAVRIGDLAIATTPFELFLDYGLRTRARSPAAQTIPVQLACGYRWYLPTERAREQGGYGTVPAVCEVGPEGGERLVTESLAALDGLF